MNGKVTTISFGAWMRQNLSDSDYRNLWFYTLIILAQGTVFGIFVGLTIAAVHHG